MRTNTECRQIVEAIDELRKEEPWSVHIPHDNPDFGGPENVEVVVNDPQSPTFRSFSGDSLLEALQAGVAWKRERALVKKLTTGANDDPETPAP